MTTGSSQDLVHSASDLNLEKIHFNQRIRPEVSRMSYLVASV